MYTLQTTKQFEKDYKLCKKRGLDLTLINAVFELLETYGILPANYRPHKLKGNYEGFLECHVQSDWLLVWSIDDTTKEIMLTRKVLTAIFSDLSFSLSQFFS